MWLSKILLRLAGWKVDITTPDYSKCIICVAPHTTNWDFVLCELANSSVGRKAGFLMKQSWFFFPLNLIFKAMGGIPVKRKNKTKSLSQLIIEKFRNSSRLVLAITPEGTRSRVKEWHTGFLHIAHEAKVPVVFGVIDGGTRTLRMNKVFITTGNVGDDMRSVKEYYSQFTAIYPDRFCPEL